MTDLPSMLAQLSALDRLLHGVLPLHPSPVTLHHTLVDGTVVGLTVDTVEVWLDPRHDSALYETCTFAVSVTHTGGVSNGTVQVDGQTTQWTLHDGCDPLPAPVAHDLADVFVDVVMHDGPAELVAQLQAARTLTQLHDLGQTLAHDATVATLLAHCPAAATASTLAVDWSGSLHELADAADALDRRRARAGT